MRRYRPNASPGVLVCLLVTCVLISCQKGPSDQQAATQTPFPNQSLQVDNSPKPAVAGGTIEAITKRGELRVGMQVGYIPFEMEADQGKITGLDLDLAEMVARSLNVNLNVVRRSWGQLIPSLLEGQIDIVMSGMTISPHRNLQALFTVPVVETGRMFMVRVNDLQRLKKLDDLNRPGIFVVSAPGGLGDIRISEVLPEASYREFPDMRSALNEVLEGRAQAIIDEEFAIRLSASTYSQRLGSSFEPLTYEPVAWAVRPDDYHWLNWLNNFILIVQRDGRMEALKKKWLHDYFLDIHQKGPRPK